MVTGDHLLIAKETCRELGMGTNILNTHHLDVSGAADDPELQATVDRVIMEAHGFAEVMPEHKFLIVERIRQQGHITGMTGDGVNDAPALKRADVGIAVHGATDAARAAAAIVLTEEGIRVTIDAMFESRKIFQRMRNYIIYRIACTMQLLFFFFFGMLCIDADGAGCPGAARGIGALRVPCSPTASLSPSRAFCPARRPVDVPGHLLPQRDAAARLHDDVPGLWPAHAVQPGWARV